MTWRLGRPWWARLAGTTGLVWPAWALLAVSGWPVAEGGWWAAGGVVLGAACAACVVAEATAWAEVGEREVAWRSRFRVRRVPLADVAAARVALMPLARGAAHAVELVLGDRPPPGVRVAPRGDNPRPARFVPPTAFVGRRRREAFLDAVAARSGGGQPAPKTDDRTSGSARSNWA